MFILVLVLECIYPSEQVTPLHLLCERVFSVEDEPLVKNVISDMVEKLGVLCLTDTFETPLHCVCKGGQSEFIAKVSIFLIFVFHFGSNSFPFSY